MDNAQLEVLRLAATGTLPDRIDFNSALSATAVKDLVSAGHLAAIDTSNLDGPGFLDARITLSGREHLQTLEARAEAASTSGKARTYLATLLNWVFGIVAIVVAAYIVRWLVGQ